MVLGRAGAWQESGSSRATVKGKKIRVVQATPPRGISRSGQAGSTGTPGPAELTPEAPGAGTGFSAQAGHTLGGGQRTPGGVERTV